MSRHMRREFYTLREAGEQLDLSPKTLRAQIYNGVLAAQKFGRDWWVERGEIERYARQHKRSGMIAAQK